MPSDAAPITLQQATALAEARNPSLQSMRASITAAEGAWRDAMAYLWNDPQIETEGRRRQLERPGERPSPRYDVGFGLSQTFEVGGQPQARRSTASSALEAVEYGIEERRREVRAKVAESFIRVLSLQARTRIEDQARALVDQGAEIVRKRVAAGENSRLDGNLAQIEAERAANQTTQIAEQLADARAALAATVQWTDSTPPEAVGDLDAAPSPYTLSDLLDSAVAQPKLQALAAKEQAAISRLHLERASRYPDVTLGLHYSNERAIDGSDRITTLSVSVPLPLFRHNASGIGRAQTELEQVRSERQAALRDTMAAVRALWRRMRSIGQRVDRLRSVVVPRLEENQALSVESLQAGAIGLSEFLLARRQALDGHRDLLDAQTELRLTRIGLETAAGWPSGVSSPEQP